MEKIKDILEISQHKKANIQQLIVDAYNRGLQEGVVIAKERAIEAIKLELVKK